jgi:hypothetical protein
MTKIMDDKLLKRLKGLAEQRCWADGLGHGDTCIDDYAAGNEDDAYYGGERSGEISLARSILEELGIEFTIEPAEEEEG